MANLGKLQSNITSGQQESQKTKKMALNQNNHWAKKLKDIYKHAKIYIPQSPRQTTACQLNLSRTIAFDSVFKFNFTLTFRKQLI